MYCQKIFKAVQETKDPAAGEKAPEEKAPEENAPEDKPKDAIVSEEPSGKKDDVLKPEAEVALPKSVAPTKDDIPNKPDIPKTPEKPQDLCDLFQHARIWSTG